MVCVTVWLVCVRHRSKNRRYSGQGHARSHFIWQWFPWCGTEAPWDLLAHTCRQKESHTPAVCPAHQGGQWEPGGWLTVCLNKVNTCARSCACTNRHTQQTRLLYTAWGLYMALFYFQAQFLLFPFCPPSLSLTLKHTSLSPSPLLGNFFFFVQCIKPDYKN